MPSAVSTEKYRSELLVQLWDHDPGATTAVIVSPDGGTTLRTVDMRDYQHFGFATMMSVISSGAFTLCEIVAAATSAMSSPEIIKTSDALVGDALDDWYFLECSAEEVAQAASTSGKTLRYVAGRITMSNSGGECKALYIATPVRPQRNLFVENNIT